VNQNGLPTSRIKLSVQIRIICAIGVPSSCREKEKSPPVTGQGLSFVKEENLL